MTAIGWGSVSILFLNSSQPFLLSITVLALAGVTAGALTSMNGLPRLSAIFITFSLIPLIIQIGLSEIEDAFALVIVIALYYLIILSSAIRMSTNTHLNIDRSIKFEERERQIRDIINASINSVITIDHDAQIIDCNDSTETLLGLNREQLLDRNLVEVFVERDNPATEIYNRLKQAIDQTDFEVDKFITELVTSSGNSITAEVSIRAISGKNQVLYTIHIYDLSEQIEQEKSPGSGK